MITTVIRSGTADLTYNIDVLIGGGNIFAIPQGPVE